MLSFSSLLSALLSLLARTLSNVVSDRMEAARVEGVNRELGRAEQAAAARARAEQEEGRARRAGSVAEYGEDDPRDLRE